MFNAKQHFEHSSLREIIVEHQFIGAALRSLWSDGIVDAEILRSEFDGFGYDLVISKGDIVRHVQLKSGLELKTVGISRLLAEKPSGCVIFLQVNDKLDMGPYFWFGDKPGKPLPEIQSLAPLRRTTHNAKGERPDRQRHHELPKSRFTKLQSLDELLEKLLFRDGAH